MIRIIHVADFHLESENPSFEKQAIVKALAKDLQSFVNESTILMFAGDLIDKGGLQFTTKVDAFSKFEDNFIKPIITENPHLQNRIFVTPGNHEVFREAIDPISESGLTERLILKKDPKEIQSFLQANRTTSAHLARLACYKNWESGFFAAYPDSTLTNFDNTFIVSLNGHKIGITLLNSSWLCKDDGDKGNLIIGRNQLEHSLEIIKDCQIKLAMAHHPLEFLTDLDREQIKPLLYKHYDILLTGHVHELASAYTQDLFGDIFISIANSTIADFPKERKFVNGYTILDFHPGNRVHACYRKYVEDHQKFVPNTDIGTETGCKDFPILKDEKLDRFEKNLQIVYSIENKYKEKLNEHIIISSNYTSTTCSIDHLFVEPKILNCPKNSMSEEDAIRYTIDDILSGDANYLIYGLKESGKTILLDKMFIDSLKKFNTYNKIPILLKFSDLKEKDGIRLIREFLSISSSDIDKFLKENKVILFLDDLQFTEKHKIHLDNLIKLRSKYPNVQIIGSSDLILDNVIPTDYLEYNDSLNFNIAFIQDFGSNEIRQLIVKWFDGREIDLQENMQKLIKSFMDFGLPKTPLSITLFLWIFEKQEKRPINNSVLVEMFIENILEKTNIENIYSDTLDFKNKQRMLAFVAKFMNDNGNPDLSYSVDYVDLLNYMKEYLSKRFPGQPQKVLDDLIRRGVLTYEDDNLVRFKAAFFYHYFLAIYIGYDSKFKIEVFTGENYLNYVEELGYYTGLKRDDIETLAFTQQKLLEAFGEYNEDISKNYTKVDNVLESKAKEGSITFQIDPEISDNKLSDKQMDDMYDQSLATIPVQKSIPNKSTQTYETNKNIDMVLKLASTVLKNSEDVDDFEAKKLAYANTLKSSISFLMQYRDSLIMHYAKYKTQPDHFPKNISFGMFIRILPLIHQVVIYNWMGSSKLRPVIIDKIESDRKTLNIPEFEKAMSIFIHGDIRGAEYPNLIKDFVKKTDFNYLKDLTFLKVMSYYHLRSNGKELDEMYLKLMADIREELGRLDKTKKTQFMQQLIDKKKGLSN